MNKKGGLLGFKVIMGAISGLLVGGIAATMHSNPSLIILSLIGGAIAGVIIGIFMPN